MQYQNCCYYLPHFTVTPIFALDVADPRLGVETESEERNHAVSSP